MEPSNVAPLQGQDKVSLKEAVIKLESTDLGPGAIAHPSVKSGPAFSLSATEWISIQTYVINALALPTTIEAFKTALGPGAPANLTDFNQLVAAYKIVNTNVTKWQNDIFPSSVSLASDIYNYAQEVPVYYNPILELAKKLVANPANKEAKEELIEILGLLSSKAKEYAQKAADVETGIKEFANKSQADKTTLAGVDGNGGLKAYYNKKYGSTSSDVQRLTKELEAQKKVLDAANEEYNHDVVVAATTPTYVFFFPLGTIAAAIVAGIYGDKAVKALEKVRAAEQQIKNIADELAADAMLLIAINNTESGISNILGRLEAALPIIQKIQGVWQAIENDLNNIVNVIKKNIENVGPAIMKLGVQTAINKWAEVGEEANAYRINAYVTVQK